MFNFFKNNNEEQPQKNTSTSAPYWVAEVDESKERFFSFLQKLEVRMQELVDAAIPELQNLKATDERAFYLMQSNINGQLGDINSKAQNAFDEKILALEERIEDEGEIPEKWEDYLENFLEECSERLNNGFEKIYNKSQKKIEKVDVNDYQSLYNDLMAEQERIKHQFKCQQCGDVIPLEKIYFIESLITCPSCQTKNTFIPSTLAIRWEEIGRGLAEQRTEPLYKKSKKAEKNERKLYHEIHELKLQLEYPDDSPKNAALNQKIKVLEQERLAEKAAAPKLYAEYERAMFDEWKSLVPDMSDHIEKVYESRQKRKI